MVSTRNPAAVTATSRSSACNTKLAPLRSASARSEAVSAAASMMPVRSHHSAARIGGRLGARRASSTASSHASPPAPDAAAFACSSASAATSSSSRATTSLPVHACATPCVLAHA